MQRSDPTVHPLGVASAPNARNVVGVFDRLEDAEGARTALISAGYDSEGISLLSRHAGADVSASDTHAGGGTIAGAGVGALVGGAAGLVALAIPGVGPLVALGPLAAALTGALSGAAMGGLAGSFAGLGIPNEHAVEYEAAVREGGVLLNVGTPNQDAAQRAEEIMAENHAREVSRYTPGL